MLSGEKQSVVSRRSDIKQPLMHVWICPECGCVVAEFSPAKALSAAKLHLERKHYYKVLVEE
jgi:ribosomal protein L37AE/L43A